MGHLQDTERTLRDLLDEGDTEKIVKWVKEQVLQSYRNGLDFGSKADKGDVRKAEAAGRRYNKR